MRSFWGDHVFFARPRGGRTIETAFDRSRNSMNLIRLLLAGFVLVSHALPISGHGVGLFYGDGELSMFAVDAFFVISGFLITGSRMGLSTGRYLWHRCLRIFPAFWVCLLLTAFVAAPLDWYHEHSSLSGFFGARHGPFVYVLRNLGLDIGFLDVAGTPAHVPKAGIWDGSLWTLRWEFLCYLFIAVLGALGWLRRRRIVLCLGVAMWVLFAFHEVAPTTATVLYAHMTSPTRFGLMFASGMLLRLYQGHVPYADWLAVVAIAELLVVYRYSPHPYVWSGPALAYVCLWLATRLPMPAFMGRNDLSYGVYIFAEPVQQLLVIYGPARWNLFAYYPACIAGALAVAAASWFLVERRALRLKRYTPGFLRADREPAPAASVPPARTSTDGEAPTQSVGVEPPPGVAG